MFDRYQELGPIYVVFDRANKERYTVQPAQHMAVNANDDRIDMYNLPDWAQTHIK
jgi:hypothetical protein